MNEGSISATRRRGSGGTGSLRCFPRRSGRSDQLLCGPCRSGVGISTISSKINGEVHYLWRALDHDGEVLEVFATKRGDRRAALKFLKRTMNIPRYDKLGHNRCWQ